MTCRIHRNLPPDVEPVGQDWPQPSTYRPRPRLKWWWWLIVGVLCGMSLALLMVSVRARDLGQWDAIDPVIKAWFSRLMQPDTIAYGQSPISCCGEADAYWADTVHVRDGKIFAVITDDRDDGPLMRIHEDIGTEYEVPPNKIVGKEQNLGNPTGHIVIFLGTAYWGANQQRTRPVLCWVDNGGA